MEPISSSDIKNKPLQLTKNKILRSSYSPTSAALPPIANIEDSPLNILILRAEKYSRATIEKITGLSSKKQRAIEKNNSQESLINERCDQLPPITMTDSSPENILSLRAEKYSRKAIEKSTGVSVSKQRTLEKHDNEDTSCNKKAKGRKKIGNRC